MNTTGPVRYSALVVDPDMETRNRLKTATMALVQFQKVQMANSLKEIEGRLEAAVDIIFVSSRFPREEIRTYVQDAKKARYTQDAAFVLLLETDEQDSSVVAENVLLGVDGFLFEPYSVDQLVEMTELAARVKKERAQEREKAAISFLLKDISHQLNLMAYLKSAGYDVGRGQRRFRQMCHVVQALEPEKVPVYYDVVTEMFGNAEFPKIIYQKNYGGASKRIKEKIEKKLLEEMEAEMEAEAASE